MKYLYKIIVILVFLMAIKVSAQQDPNYTLYVYNMNLINPAYAGADNSTDLGVNIRSQWSNVKGAPETQSFIFGTPVGKNLGVGLSIISDKTFIEKQTSIAADFSYHLKLSENHDLFFGFKAGFNSYNANTEGLVTYGIQEDPNLMNLSGRFNPNFGAGAYFSHEKYFLTLSIPKILSNDRLEEENGTARAGSDMQHIYLGGGYNISLNGNMVLRPSVLMRYVNASPLSVDITSMLEFGEYFNLGVAYRVNESVSGLAIFKVSNSLKIGYAYEVATHSAVRYMDNGTHEIMLNLKL
ncbi:type IX secretion system membrane protein PorP/SprF [Maribacter sp. MAR_2009_72]|uniref:PorP/SprF family type IX secretion system membrane protein n=1 Tax=Maribacter sp. MAR_2009_72 TaxID=1250050 RepID=UPI00119BEE06|nr:type IX secretion system membrane protein PorP/SprF [Maribacter sp. MAR_2009_72]TVZ16965.1 type IX secretion system PorP/SprF family membrane protein [Maribacter sp. MAR_2009_72]